KEDRQQQRRILRRPHGVGNAAIEIDPLSCRQPLGFLGKLDRDPPFEAVQGEASRDRVRRQALAGIQDHMNRLEAVGLHQGTGFRFDPPRIERGKGDDFAGTRVMQGHAIVSIRIVLGAYYARAKRARTSRTTASCRPERPPSIWSSIPTAQEHTYSRTACSM